MDAKSDIADEDREFLEFCQRNPDLSVSRIYQGLGLSGYRGDRLKSSLLERRLLVEVATRLGKGGKAAKFLLLTPDAERALGCPPSRGKGGPVHRYLQGRFAREAFRKGYTVELEAVVDRHGDSVDLSLERQGQRIAVEVVVGADLDQIMRDIQKYLAAEYDSILIVGQGDLALLRIKEEAGKKLAAVAGEKLRFCVVDKLSGEI